MWYHAVNDEIAAGISQALAATENSRETKLTLCISNKLTVCGAKVMAHSLKQSHNIKILCISYSSLDGGPNGNVLQPLLVVAIEHMQELGLCFDLTNTVANNLSAIFLSWNFMMRTNRALQTLDLRVTPNMTVKAAHRLAKGLRHAKLKSLRLIQLREDLSRRLVTLSLTIGIAVMNGVENLDLADYVTDERVVEIEDALIGNKTLQSFKFHLEDDLTVGGAMRLANGISRSHLVHLDMGGRSTNANFSADVMDALYGGVARLPTIRHLTLGKQFCDTPQLLTQCITRLHSFEMHDSVKVEDLPAFMTALRTAPYLSSLVLGHTCGNAQDILTVCAALPHLISLTDFTICCRLSFMEEHASNLKSQRIHATGAEKLMVAVASHPSLVCLTLIDCYDFGFVGLAMIGMHLPNIRLKKLNLMNFHECTKWVVGLTSDKQQAFQRACQALVDGVKANRHLHDLTLEGRFLCFPSKVKQEIKFFLDLNKLGQSLLHATDSENLPSGLWCHVLAKCGKVSFTSTCVSSPHCFWQQACATSHYKSNI